jgi:parvulin-like peptidyl-prolyl isomerase
MKRAHGLAGALLLGILAGEYLTTNFAFRAWLGRVAGRGDLVALVGPRGIYEGDLERTGRNLESLIDEAKVTGAARSQPVSPPAIAHEMDLLRWQFPDEKTWRAALEKAGTTTRGLRSEVTANLRARAWLEAKLARPHPPNESDILHFCETPPKRFLGPQRFRASHLFLAAPEGAPADIVTAKRALSEALALRLRNGESFSALVAEFSEDDATKGRDGDLNYFAAARMLPAVWNAAQTLAEGTNSPPFRSRLGFHILRMTRRLPPEELSLVQATPEIVAALENAERAVALPALFAPLGGKIQFAARGN